MHITNVTATNLKGRTFSYDLSPLTIIAGKNYSGKTAIIEAVRLALLGYIPEIGKRNQSTFELSSGTSMQTQVTILENGTELKIWRNFRQERGSVKAEVSGEEKRFQTPLLDAAAYFELTESQRVDYVFEQVAMPAEFTVDGIIAKLQRISFGEAHTEELETAKAEVIAVCRDGFLPEGATIQEHLSALVDETLKADLAAWKKRADDTQGAVRIMTELKNREGECSAETLTDLRNRASHLAGLIDECNRESGALRARAQDAQKVRTRIESLEAALVLPEPNWPTPQKSEPKTPVPIDTAPLEERVNFLAAQLADTTPPDAVALWRERDDAAIAYNEAQRRVDAAAVDAQDAKEELDNMKAGKCPTCGSAIKVDAKKKAAATKKLKEMSAMVSNLGQMTILAKSRYEVANTAANTAANKVQAELDAYGKLQSEHQQALTILADTQRANLDSAQQYSNECARAEIAYEKELERLSSIKQRWHNQRDNDRLELERLRTFTPPPQSDVDASTQKASDLLAQMNEARTKVAAAERLQHDLQRANEALHQHSLAAARATVIKEVREVLKQQKADMVTTAFTELLRVANYIVRGILLYPIAYSAERNEIGFMSDVGFIGHRTWSGTEKALGYIAIAAALSAKSDFRLLILDELARVTASIQDAVRDRLQQCVSGGILDQCILVIPTEADMYYVEGWTTILTK